MALKEQPDIIFMSKFGGERRDSKNSLRQGGTGQSCRIFLRHEQTMICKGRGGQLSIDTQFNNTFWLHIGSKTMTHIQALCVTYVHPYIAVAPKSYL